MKTEFKPAAIVLAAGYSSRMGAFKPLLSIGDLPALTHVIRNLKLAGISDIAVVTGHLHEKLTPLIESEGAFEIFNPDYDKGMFSSILSGIRNFMKFDDSTTGVLLSPVDCPLVPADTLKAILEQAKTERDCFIVPCFRGKKGHPLWIPSSMYNEIMSYEGNMGLKGITSKHEFEFLRIDVDNEGVVLDMDTMDAYEKLLSFYNKGSNTGDFFELSKGRRFILVRHGRPVQHDEKIFMGQYDPPLDDTGAEQALAASIELSKLSIVTDKIYSSDLLRAQQTARLIGDKLGISNIDLRRGLREMSLGAWDGRFISDIKCDFPIEFENRGKNLLTFKIDTESENFYDLQYRVLDCVTDILKHDLKHDILIVSHSGVIKTLYGNLKGHDIKWAISEFNPGNASVTVVNS